MEVDSERGNQISELVELVAKDVVQRTRVKSRPINTGADLVDKRLGKSWIVKRRSRPRSRRNRNCASVLGPRSPVSKRSNYLLPKKHDRNQLALSCQLSRDTEFLTCDAYKIIFVIPAASATTDQQDIEMAVLDRREA